MTDNNVNNPRGSVKVEGDSMKFCLNCPTNPSCQTCIQCIEGGVLRKKVSPPRYVTLLNLHQDKQFAGKLIVLSRLGMLIQTQAPKGPYTIELECNTIISLSPIHNKNFEGFIAFDIVKVERENEKDDLLSKEEYEYLFSSKQDMIDKITENLDESVKESVRNMLQTQLAKSEILDRLLVGSSMKYEKGRIRLLSGRLDPLVKEDQLLKLMGEAIDQNAPSREVMFCPKTEKYLDIHAIPLSYDMGGFITLDISEVMAKEKQIRQEQWESYKDVIYSLTHSKIELVKKDEMEKVLADYERQIHLDLAGAEQLSELRKMIKEQVEAIGISPSFKVMLAVTEAASNAIKHANDSRVEVWTKGEEALILIIDQGQGIQTKILPKATLIQGFSTKNSLGQGFHIMTQYSDKLFIKSDRSGTIIGMTFKNKAQMKTG